MEVREVPGDVVASERRNAERRWEAERGVAVFVPDADLAGDLGLLAFPARAHVNEVAQKHVHMMLLQARKVDFCRVGIVRVEPEERGASHRAHRLLSIEAIIGVRSVAFVPSYFLCVEEGGDFCLGKIGHAGDFDDCIRRHQVRPEGVLQHCFRAIAELLVHFFDGVRTVSAVLSVHANSRNGLDAIGGVERNGGEVDVVAPKLGEPRRGAPAESHDRAGVVRVHPLFLCGPTQDQRGLVGWAAHVVGPIVGVYRAIDTRVRVGVPGIGMCLGDFHARVLRGIVQENVVVIWNLLFVLAVDCHAGVPRFRAVRIIGRVVHFVHSRRRYGTFGAHFGLDGDRLISLHLDVEEARPRDTAVLVLRVDGDGLHLGHALHVEVVVGRYQGKRRGRDQKRADKDDGRRHASGEVTRMILMPTTAHSGVTGREGPRGGTPAGRGARQAYTFRGRRDDSEALVRGCARCGVARMWRVVWVVFATEVWVNSLTIFKETDQEF